MFSSAIKILFAKVFVDVGMASTMTVVVVPPELLLKLLLIEFVKDKPND
jgi:hypothetical protein